MCSQEEDNDRLIDERSDALRVRYYKIENISFFDTLKQACICIIGCKALTRISENQSEEVF